MSFGSVLRSLTTVGCVVAMATAGVPAWAAGKGLVAFSQANEQRMAGDGHQGDGEDLAPDAGTIAVEGDIRHAIDPGLGHRLGIGVICQETDLVPAMTVAENIFLGHEPVRAGIMLRGGAMRAAAAALMSRFDLRFPLDSPLRDLGPAQRQPVQILKALSRRIKILVLDGPTASLTETEIAYLFGLLRELRTPGLGIIYVSHRLGRQPR